MKMNIVATAFLLTGTTFAYNSEHGPLPDDAGPERIGLHELTKTEVSAAEEELKVFRFNRAGENDHRLIVYGTTNGFDVELMSGERILLSRKPFTENQFFLGVQAFTSDLNQDDIPDYLVYSYSGGCGLANGYCTIGFILSSGDRYHLTSVETLFPDESDYVVMDGKSCFIHTAFFGEEECNDGKDHNFWIYNLLVIDGAAILLNNSVHPDFPKIIWYTFDPNHKETTIITDEQKARLVEKAQDGIFWKHE